MVLYYILNVGNFQGVSLNTEHHHRLVFLLKRVQIKPKTKRLFLFNSYSDPYKTNLN